jgi:opacity protein-like surface antigen
MVDIVGSSLRGAAPAGRKDDVMVRATISALAGAASLISTAALAADLPPPLPPPVYRAPVVVDAGGWYLRGDVGVGMQNFKSFDFTQTNPAFVWPASWRIDQKDMKSATFIGFGIGYAWNNWLRFDFTGEYRAKVPLKVLGSYSEACVAERCFDLYDINHSAWVGLINAYLDLGTWWCLTPFIGVGVGGAYSTTHSATDIGFTAVSPGFGYASEDHYSKWTFAWAFHAGLAYTVTNSFKVEFAYRYLNMGDVRTAVIDCAAAGCGGAVTGGPSAYYTLTNFDSHDFRIGMRWLLQQEPPPAYPLMRKG